MDKVKITREQADAIDEMFKQGINNKCKIIELHVKEPNGWRDHCAPLNEMLLDDLIIAIYIGYEVEETPEDKVREYYHNVADYDPPRTAVKRVLNLLNIKIVGVNHE